VNFGSETITWVYSSKKNQSKEITKMDVQKITNTFLQFQYPGYIVAELGNAKKVANREIGKITVPRGATGFRFFDVIEAMVDGESLRSEKKNVSGWFYIGEEFTVEQVEALNTDGSYDILLSNMTGNKHPTVVRTFHGNWFPVNKEDKVIAPDTVKWSKRK
jgi:hypothetical protein